MRCALILSYDGTHFLGSQTQKSSNNTILGNLQKVLSTLSIDSKIIASGRTDKGVHATGQVCHIDLPEFWTDIKKLKKVLNEMLPSSIKVKNIKKVEAKFHARYSAKKRVYRYIIKESKSNPFEANYVTFLDSVDFEAIQKNIKLFIGEHNFSNFKKTGSDTKSNIRVIFSASAYKHKKYIVLNFEANGFLRSQIRLMVGALLKLDASEIISQLNCEKNFKIRPAPCNGLYLSKIKY
ncbi:tRNA pseudouridine(38-40) synthase TruA [Sulfurimonas sp.]|uniref:tRNA pseudouridine(38-40) synthase TruA n=1 Tax=Sulfurimonas sp. TaxID=2022749 RepID=UPI002AAF67B7|nr:tRNA pseudouridine(38-40) synthase TruA [Sulfurimonas sp.]